MNFRVFSIFLIVLLTKPIEIKTICMWGECCDSTHVTHDFKLLEKNLTEVLFGQPLVKSTLIGALKAHFKLDNPPKPLVLSLHGATGTGKNHVARIVAGSLYKKGIDSEFVLTFSATRDFPLNSQVNAYKDRIKAAIEEKIKNCKHSLFIFDEMDKIPVELMNVIKPFIDHLTKAEAIKYQHSVFMFLSNSASQVINHRAFNLYLKNVKRESFELKMFRKIIEDTIYTEINDDKKGFWHLVLIKNQLIDYYIPFLPLEHEHVRKCISTEFEKYGVSRKNTPSFDKHVESIDDQLTYEPEGHNLYATSGCKRIPQLVRLFIYDAQKSEL